MPKISRDADSALKAAKKAVKEAGKNVIHKAIAAGRTVVSASTFFLDATATATATATAADADADAADAPTPTPTRSPSS